MDRRDLLKMGALGGASVVGSIGCGAQGGLRYASTDERRWSHGDVMSFLANVDGGIAHIDKGHDRLPKSFAKIREIEGVRDAANPGLPPSPEELERTERVFRKAMRSLLLVGSFSDMPPEARMHPAVQERMWRAMPDMDEGMLGMKGLLDELTPTEASDIGRVMQRSPGLGMHIAESLDIEAAHIGISMARRNHLRSIASHVSFRLAQSTPLLVSEYRSTVERVASRDATIAEAERTLAVRLGRETFWKLRDDSVSFAQRWAHDPSVPITEPRGGTAITVGAILLGIGAVTAGLGGLAIAGGGGIGGAFVITLGAALGLAGLITLIVGLALRATS